MTSNDRLGRLVKPLTARPALSETGAEAERYGDT